VIRNFCATLLLGLVLGIGPVWAQEGAVAPEAEVASEEDHGSILDVIFRWLNFLVLFGGLGYLLRKPASEFFEARRQAIQDGLGRAQKAQEESGQKLADIESRLAQLSVEIAKLQEDAKAVAEAEHERIMADGSLEVDRAMQQSTVEIERLARGFELEIRSHVADLVIKGATERLQGQISEKAQRHIVHRVVSEI